MSGLSENPSHIVLRRASVKLTWAVSSSFSFGLVKEVKMKCTPIAAGRDSRGRTQVAGYDCTIEFIAMQTHADDLALLGGLNQTGNLQLLSGAHSIGLPEVQPRFEFDFDGAGGISGVKCMADVILEKHQFIDVLVAAGSYGA